MNLKTKGSPCYFCGDPSIDVEHVPPQQLFSSVVVSEITVPSCDLHNRLKGKFDDAMIKGLLQALDEFLETKQMKPEDVHPNVHALIQKVKPNFPQAKKLVGKSPMFRPGQDQRGKDHTAVTKDERLEDRGRHRFDRRLFPLALWHRRPGRRQAQGLASSRRARS